MTHFSCTHPMCTKITNPDTTRCYCDMWSRRSTVTTLHGTSFGCRHKTNLRTLGKSKRTQRRCKQKLARFLLYHDQKTAGIPGILQIYEGMKARSNEKLAKGARITLLKHTPCTVVGWELHPADKTSKTSAVGSQRVLQYLPRVFFVKFSHVEWEISPALGKRRLSSPASLTDMGGEQIDPLEKI